MDRTRNHGNERHLADSAAIEERFSDLFQEISQAEAQRREAFARPVASMQEYPAMNENSRAHVLHTPHDSRAQRASVTYPSLSDADIKKQVDCILKQSHNTAVKAKNELFDSLRMSRPGRLESLFRENPETNHRRASKRLSNQDGACARREEEKVYMDELSRILMHLEKEIMGDISPADYRSEGEPEPELNEMLQNSPLLNFGAGATAVNEVQRSSMSLTSTARPALVNNVGSQGHHESLSNAAVLNESKPLRFQEHQFGTTTVENTTESPRTHMRKRGAPTSKESMRFKTPEEVLEECLQESKRKRTEECPSSSSSLATNWQSSQICRTRTMGRNSQLFYFEGPTDEYFAVEEKSCKVEWPDFLSDLDSHFSEM